jgi:plastocyanin
MKKLIGAVIGIAAIAPAGLASARPDVTAHAAASTDAVSGKEFSFHLAKKSIAKAGKVTFIFRNVGTTGHVFDIGGKKTPLVNPGKTARLTVTFHEKGRFNYLCTVPGHAQAGMKGVFTVR